MDTALLVSLYPGAYTVVLSDGAPPASLRWKFLTWRTTDLGAKGSFGFHENLRKTEAKRSQYRPARQLCAVDVLHSASIL